MTPDCQEKVGERCAVNALLQSDLGRSVPRGCGCQEPGGPGRVSGAGGRDGVEGQVAGGLVRRVRAPERKGKRGSLGRRRKRWDLFA